MTGTEQSVQPTVVDDMKVDGRVASSPHEQRHARSRVGRRGWIALGATAAALAGAAVTVLAAGSASGGAKPVASGGPTATIARRDLVQTDDQQGTLGYSGGATVYSQLGGVVTWLPQAGDVIRPNKRLFALDQTPVILMDGRVPASRTLARGVSDGADVRELKSDLVALGYDPENQITIDEHFDSATSAAIDRWEAAHGLTETGQVQLGRIVFLPGAQRVATVTASLGEALPGTPASGSSSAGGSSSSSIGAGAGSSAGGTASGVLTATSDHQVVTVQLETSKQTEAVAGEHVEVTLPSGAVAQGTISRVGRVAQTSSQAATSNSQSSNGGNSTGGAGAAPQATVPVTIQLRRASGLGALDQAPVTVAFALATRHDVLAIPVSALLATAGGGYAIDVVNANHTTTRLPVTAGAFAGGYVEVSGAGISAGTQIADTAGS
jgi:peptidoglycan hydrolase-like protein with peptidoglycan-binding domain